MNTNILLSELIAVKQLIATPETWCQGVSAVNSTNNLVPPTHPTACKWCVIGAMAKIGMSYDHVMTINRACAVVRFLSLPQLNDNDGFYAVHIFLDEFIEKLHKLNNKNPN